MIIDPVDVMLFMPEGYFAEMHGHAQRLGLSDAALFTGCWQAARKRITSDPASPRLTSSPSGQVYVAMATIVRDDVAAFAEGQDRSMSWAVLKAWEMARAEVRALDTAEQFHAWVSVSAERAS